MLRTPLYEQHVKLGAKMVPFAGWEMPIQYSSIIEEHEAVRKTAGIFDVSHMGDLMVRGEGAKDLLARLFTNNIEDLPVGKGLYGHILDDQGCIIDDAIIYHYDEGAYLMVPNAATKDKVLAWVKAHATGQEIMDLSSRVACIALQGPRAAEILEDLTFADLPSMKRNSAELTELFADPDVTEGLFARYQPSGFLCDVLERMCRPNTKGQLGFNETAYLCRTGYTGEDGFEILVENPVAPILWQILLREGAGRGLRPCGLGARDTLRLEMGFLLSGTDFDGAQTTLQTGPQWVLKLEREFIGKQAIVKQREAGDYERLVCLELLEKGVPRHGYEIMVGGEVVGKVTSGTLSPCLKKGIAMGYVRPPHDAEGGLVEIVIRGASVKAKVVRPPFLRGR
ncbi:MAG: glycine cleavage system protein T [Methanomassiliicoccales archaeon]|nr:glycine cleavage system protein T [Methanomassiliicoccales archaeon]